MLSAVLVALGTSLSVVAGANVLCAPAALVSSTGGTLGPSGSATARAPHGLIDPANARLVGSSVLVKRRDGAWLQGTATALSPESIRLVDGGHTEVIPMGDVREIRITRPSLALQQLVEPGHEFVIDLVDGTVVRGVVLRHLPDGGIAVDADSFEVHVDWRDIVGIAPGAFVRGVREECLQLRLAVAGAKLALRDCLALGGGCAAEFASVEEAQRRAENCPEETSPTNAAVTPAFAVAARAGLYAGRHDGKRIGDVNAPPAPPVLLVPDMIGMPVVVSADGAEATRGILLGKDAVEIELVMEGNVFRSLKPAAVVSLDTAAAPDDDRRSKYAQLYADEWQRSYLYGYEEETRSRRERRTAPPPDRKNWTSGHPVLETLNVILQILFCLTIPL